MDREQLEAARSQVMAFEDQFEDPAPEAEVVDQDSGASEEATGGFSDGYGE